MSEEKIEPRFAFIGDDDRKEIYDTSDVIYVDLVDGKYQLSLDIGEHHKPMFTMPKGYMEKHKDSLYLSFLVYSIRCSNGAVHLMPIIESLHHDKEWLDGYMQKVRSAVQSDMDEQMEKNGKVNDCLTVMVEGGEVWVTFYDFLPEMCTSFELIDYNIVKATAKFPSGNNGV